MLLSLFLSSIFFTEKRIRSIGINLEFETKLEWLDTTGLRAGQPARPKT